MAASTAFARGARSLPSLPAVRPLSRNLLAGRRHDCAPQNGGLDPWSQRYSQSTMAHTMTVQRDSCGANAFLETLPAGGAAAAIHAAAMHSTATPSSSSNARAAPESSDGGGARTATAADIVETAWASSSETPGAEDNVVVSKKQLLAFLKADITYSASQPARPVSMQQMLDTAEPTKIAKFIQLEVPNRYAKRMLQIESLPHWQEVPELVRVHERLFGCFKELKLVQRNKEVGLQPFTTAILEAKSICGDVVKTVTAGMRMWYHDNSSEYEEEFVNRWLDEFLLLRIGIEMLTSQYIAIAPIEYGGKGNPTGIIDMVDVTAACKKAAKQTAAILESELGNDVGAPIVRVSTFSSDGGKICHFTYVAGYLYFILVELLKNSFRATVEKTESGDMPTPIHIIVSCDEERVAIRISDQAGGIPFEVGDRIWSYLYTTAEKPSSLAGHGVGLPLSRLYAEYLGGRLELQTMPGYGTDAYLLLPRVHSSSQVECVPCKSAPLPARRNPSSLSSLFD
eukprot:TRINITY_DN80347_c0_g1_i1.p1 TRINITY_DN80347_c0_g1~~TRINITY_DN80347_c0_g1_i1.p1  ORF type:complete len:512 (+),score=110.60 TRINITY_DN80347_c0_g1_i1:95-1630(+)